MALEIKPSELTGKAVSTLKGFEVNYSFKHLAGQKPTTIQARATKEGTKEIFDVLLFTSNGNLQNTVHYSTPETDFTMIAEIVKEIYELLNSL